MMLYGMVKRSSYASDKESTCFLDESSKVDDCRECLSVNTNAPRQVMAYSSVSSTSREYFTSLLAPNLKKHKHNIHDVIEQA